MQKFDQEDYKRQKLQLILQALQQLGFERTVKSLSTNASIQHETVQVQMLRTKIFEGKLDEALEYINQFNLEDNVQHQIQLILMEQKYLQLLQQNDTIKAVEVLRKLIQPICQDKDKMHNLATHLMITMQPEEEELSSEKIVIKSSLDVFSEVFALCHKEIDGFQPKRLESLFIQAKAMEIIDSAWHPGLDDNFTILMQNHQTKKLDEHIQIIEIKNHTDEILFCQFSPNGRYLSSVCKASRLCIWELQSQQTHQPNHQNPNLQKHFTWNIILNQTNVHSQPIHFITFSPCSQLLATCSQDQTAKVFMLFPEPKLLYTLKGLQSRISGLGWKLSTSNDHVQKQKTYFSFLQRKAQQDEFIDFWEIYTGSSDGWVNIWKCGQKRGGFKTEPVTQLIIFKDKIYLEHAPIRKISIFDSFRKVEIKSCIDKDEIVSSCMNQDFSLILVNVSYSSPKLNLYSSDNLQLLKSFSGYQQTKCSLRGCFGWYNQNIISIGSEDGNLLMWHQYHNRKPLMRIKISNEAINQVAFNQEYPQIFSLACSDKVLRICYPDDIIMKVNEPEIKGPRNMLQNLFFRVTGHVLQQQEPRGLDSQALQQTMLAEEDQSMDYESQEGSNENNENSDI